MLHGHVRRALQHSKTVWPPIEAAHRLVLHGAQVLANLGDDAPETVERQFDRVLHALQHFLKVSESYGSNLFATYRLPGLPRTNNDLEQFFGSVRYHELASLVGRSLPPAP